MDVTALSDVQRTLLVQGYCRDVGDLELDVTEGQLGMCVDLRGLPGQNLGGPLNMMYMRTIFVPVQECPYINHWWPTLLEWIRNVHDQLVTHPRVCRARADNVYLRVEHEDGSAHFDIETNTLQTIRDVLLQLEKTTEIEIKHMALYEIGATMPLNRDRQLHYYNIRSFRELVVHFHVDDPQTPWSDTTSEPQLMAHRNLGD